MICIVLAMSIAMLPPAQAHSKIPGGEIVEADGQPVVLADFQGNVRDGSARRAMQDAFARAREALAAHHLRRPAASLPMASMGHFDDETGVLTGAVGYAVRTRPSGALEAGVHAAETPAGRLVRFETHRVFGRANPDYEDFGGWMAKQGLRPRAEAWEVYAGPALAYVYYPLP